ncbi:hypothetical protein BDV18DRAFT_141477 [Aspergillus unguis]
MAGEEDNKKQQSPSSPESSRQWPNDNENPFDAFRRFADEQISSILQSVMGLPSSLTPPRSERWPVFADEQHYRDAQRRQRQEYNNESTDADNASNSRNNDISTQNNNTSNATSKRWPDSDNSFDIDTFFNSFFDRFWLDEAVSSRLFYPYQHPPFSSMTSSESPAWPINYLMFSPYSPLHLERQARYRSHRDQGVFSSLMSSMSFMSEAECDPQEPKWREAFEDLLRLENGKPMLDRDPSTEGKLESGKDWLKGLAQRGSLGSQWKFEAGSEGQPWSGITLSRFDRGSNDRAVLETQEPTPTKKAESLPDGSNAKPLTELDMYERFLADIEAREREFFGAFHHSPLLQFLLQDQRRSRREGDLSSENESKDDTESWLELVSGGNKHSVPEFDSSQARAAPPSTPSPAVEPQASIEKPSVEHNSYVVSTQINTNRVRLPDGSIQTKTVKTMRFADGREETNESTEVVSPPRHNQISDQQSSEKKNGWFWKD